jgi:hypothetical protein
MAAPFLSLRSLELCPALFINFWLAYFFSRSFFSRSRYFFESFTDLFINFSFLGRGSLYNSPLPLPPPSPPVFVVLISMFNFFA